MIDWIAPALGSPATFSVVSLLDKAVLSRFGLSSSGLSLFVGGNQLVLASVVLLIGSWATFRWGVWWLLGAGESLTANLSLFSLKRKTQEKTLDKGNQREGGRE